MQTTQTERHFLFILLAIVTVVALLILYPFLTVFILSAAFAVVLYPMYLWIKNHTYKQKSWFASLMTVIVFMIGLCVPLFLIGTAVFNQTQDAYYSIVANGGAGNFIERVDSSINKILPEGFYFDTQTKITGLIESFAGNLASIFTGTFNTIIMFTIMILSLFYLLKDGEKWKKGLISLLPLSDKNAEEILSNLSLSINRVLKGSFIVAIAQGILAWIGFTIFGVPNAAIWAVVAGIASFIPTLGTSVVSVPAILYLFLSGLPLHAVGLLAWSAVLIGLIDNLLSPYIISKDTEIPSLFILFSILGGISLLGPIGILIGPLVLSLLQSLVSIYKKELRVKAITDEKEVTA